MLVPQVMAADRVSKMRLVLLVGDLFNGLDVPDVVIGFHISKRGLPFLSTAGQYRDFVNGISFCPKSPEYHKRWTR